MKTAVYDLEVYKNYFNGIFIDARTDKKLVDKFVEASIKKDKEKKRKILAKISHQSFIIKDIYFLNIGQEDPHPEEIVTISFRGVPMDNDRAVAAYKMIETEFAKDEPTTHKIANKEEYDEKSKLLKKYIADFNKESDYLQDNLTNTWVVAVNQGVAAVAGEIVLGDTVLVSGQLYEYEGSYEDGKLTKDSKCRLGTQLLYASDIRSIK